MFRALLAQHQETLHKQQLVYGARIMSALHIPIAVYAAPPEDEQVVLETSTGCQFIANHTQNNILLGMLY
jgi:hypothetical protein